GPTRCAACGPAVPGQPVRALLPCAPIDGHARAWARGATAHYGPARAVRRAGRSTVRRPRNGGRGRDADAEAGAWADGGAGGAPVRRRVARGGCQRPVRVGTRRGARVAARRGPLARGAAAAGVCRCAPAVATGGAPLGRGIRRAGRAGPV